MVVYKSFYQHENSIFISTYEKYLVAYIHIHIYTTPPPFTYAFLVFSELLVSMRHLRPRFGDGVYIYICKLPPPPPPPPPATYPFQAFCLKKDHEGYVRNIL